MARSSSAVKALEKALQKLKTQESAAPSAAEAPATRVKSESKTNEYLVKESKKFGEGLMSYYEEEKNRIKKFLDTINEIESGTYKPRRGGRRTNAGRKPE
jgi:hypothetical protein